MTTPARTRVAPSPTGDPHVGTAYQALFNRAHAQATGGQFVLRIEDTDRTRLDPTAEDKIFAALRWLGLTWDEGPDVGGPFGPYRQSERTHLYASHAEILVERGAAYRCFCTPERLAALREDQKARKLPLRYDGACAGLGRSEADGRAAGEASVVRLRVPSEGRTVVHDEARGDVTFENAGIDDQVLLKSDGHPTYHLANVVDDHLMQITHVIRGEEWLPSAPKHVLLYAAFGWDPPRILHTPLLRNPDRSKFSKRRNPTSLDWYRAEGYLPEALLNFLATLGWSHPEGKERFGYDEFVALLDWSRMSLSGPIFDMEKLSHLNGSWIRSLGVDELSRRLVDGGFTGRAGAPPDLFRGAVELSRERLSRLADFDDLTAFFFERPRLTDAGQLVGKKAAPEAVKTALRVLRERLEGTEPWDVPSVEAAVREIAGAAELKARDVFMAARVAVTGRTVSTPLFETVVALGRQETLQRLDAAVELL